jgi:hypothetical protein
MFDLSDKVALVTGASGGIGNAIAACLHAAGASVALTGTRKDALDALAGELGERVLTAPANLTDPETPASLVKTVEEGLGPIDILVNNAGLTRDMLSMRLADEDWATVLEVNLGAAFRLSRAVLRGMMQRRRAGELRGIEGRHDRHVEVDRPGSGGARRHGELPRARFHRDGDDRCPQGRHQEKAARGRAGAASRNARRRGRRGALSGERRGQLRDRPNVARKRWYGHEMIGEKGVLRRCWPWPGKCVNQAPPRRGAAFANRELHAFYRAGSPGPLPINLRRV